MTLQEFQKSVSSPGAPAQLGKPLVALWHDARGEWDKAHAVAQSIGGPTGAWIHAYLHRKEGDFSNAGYWYERARKSPATGSLDDEWKEIAGSLLKEKDA